MSGDWIQLLVGALLFGAALVVAMVAPAPGHVFAVVVAALSMVFAVAGVGTITAAYGTAESVALAVFFLLAAIVGGYWTAAAALPLLVHRGTARRTHPATSLKTTSDETVVVMLSAAPPERYSARAVAASQHLLIEDGGVHIPTTAAPFMYLSEKTRYRAIGGTLRSRDIARTTATLLQDRLRARGHACRVVNAWTPASASLDETMTRATETGAERIVVAPLGSDLTIDMAHSLRELEDLWCRQSGPSILRAEPIWLSTSLAYSLAERIIGHASDTSRDRLGVVLVADGQPPAWEATHLELGEQQNYFAQRVRLHLGECGVDERHVRMSWLEWQVPDVTESVRHVAALGCTRIIVVPGLIPLPTLATEIDVQHAVRLARVSETVAVTVLPPWAEDGAIVDVLTENVATVLEHA